MRRLALLLLLILATGARAGPVVIPGPDGILLKANLVRPAGPVVAPAIVALHGCGGAFPKRDRQWSELLSGAGHIVLFPDSFGSRGLGSQCRIQSGERLAKSGGLRRRDALASARWLAAQPGTPPGGVVLLGWSDGSSTVLAAGAAAPDLPPGLLRGLIAFYPGCRGAAHTTGWKPAAPLLILIGELDDWTPAAPCRVLANKVGAPLLTLVTYPGAYHDFDAPVPVRVRQNIPSGHGPYGEVHAGGNPEARADALTRVPAFLLALPASGQL
jgi:dienelactone hydrolase